MAFTVTSSNCKVKIARFYEFLVTLGFVVSLSDAAIVFTADNVSLK